MVLIRAVVGKRKRNRSGAGVALDPLTCSSCQVRSRSDWCEVGDDRVREIDRVAACDVYRPGQTIFRQGQPCTGIYVLESGTIALRQADDRGNCVLVRLAHAGDTLGYRALFAGTAHPLTAEALEVSRTCFIDQARVRAALASNASLGLRFLARMSRHLQESDDARLRSVTLSVRARVAHLLLVLRDRFASVDDDGVMTILLPLSRQDMADMVGTRPETIARTIRALTRDGAACFEGRRVTVRDLDALWNEVEGHGALAAKRSAPAIEKSGRGASGRFAGLIPNVDIRTVRP